MDAEQDRPRKNALAGVVPGYSVPLRLNLGFLALIPFGQAEGKGGYEVWNPCCAGAKRLSPSLFQRKQSEVYGRHREKRDLHGIGFPSAKGSHLGAERFMSG